MAERSGAGRGRGGGREKSLDVLRRLAVGESLFKDIVSTRLSRNDVQNLELISKFNSIASNCKEEDCDQSFEEKYLSNR